MLQTWRWFGPKDPVPLDHVRQSGASGIVTALHETYDGEEWSAPDIARRQAEIESAGLVWSVVESIPVHASLKLGTRDAAQFVDAYGATIRKLATAGIGTICYNFMPVVDWTRTDLRYPLPNGALALRFDAVDFASSTDGDPTTLFDPNDLLNDPKDTITRIKVFDENGDEIEGVTVTQNGFKQTSLGVMELFEQIALGFTDSIDGLLTNRRNTIDRQIKTQEERIDAINTQLATKRLKLEREFLAMEQVIASLQTQSQALNSLSFGG